MATETKTVYKRLFRSEDNRVLAGVCGGIGEYFNIDPSIIRLVLVLITLFGGGGVLIYLVLWLVIPSAGSLSKKSDEHIKENIQEMRDRAKSLDRDDSRFLFGIAIVAIGIIFLLGNFHFWDFFNFGKLWPILIIIAGVIMLTKKDGKE